MNMTYLNLFDFDNSILNNSGFDFIIGTDEAGRGSAAGDVRAAAVCFGKDINTGLLEGLDDSKKLTPKKRKLLYEVIKENSCFSIKKINVQKIEEINILNAALLAMENAVIEVLTKINSENVLVLIDGNKLLKNYSYPQQYIIKGDSKSAAIAAASILAKVNRDSCMDKIHLEYPEYNWNKNKGYLTKSHIEAIKTYGLTKYHRPSFLKKILK